MLQMRSAGRCVLHVGGSPCTKACHQGKLMNWMHAFAGRAAVLHRPPVRKIPRNKMPWPAQPCNWGHAPYQRSQQSRQSTRKSAGSLEPSVKPQQQARRGKGDHKIVHAKKGISKLLPNKERQPLRNPAPILHLPPLSALRLEPPPPERISQESRWVNGKGTRAHAQRGGQGGGHGGRRSPAEGCSAPAA